MALIDKLKSWARNAWNWLNKFFKKLWGRIINWWSKLRTWLKECIAKYKEIVVLDSREDGGRELIEAIRNAQPRTITIDEIDNGPVTISIDHNDNIDKVDSHEAEVMQEGQYEAKQAEFNGVLRIAG